LKFCLEGTRRNLVEWGHEYLRSLAGEIGQEHNKRVEKQANEEDLFQLVDVIIPYFMKNHEEPEAVDLLMEIEQLEKLLNFTTDANYERVCNYLLSCCNYASRPRRNDECLTEQPTKSSLNITNTHKHSELHKRSMISISLKRLWRLAKTK